MKLLRLLLAADVRFSLTRVPQFLSVHSSENTVQTTAQRGWDKLKNGELLKAAEDAGFDVLLTPDKNIRYQQNLAIRRVALVVLGNRNGQYCACMWSVLSLP
jgi:hypothetical protein